MKTLKELFIERVVADVVAEAGNGTVRVMDLGCGTAAYAPALLAAHPNLHYVGVEPIETSFKRAEANLAGHERATLHFQLGYDSVFGAEESSCDLVFSLSVLEHIKQLPRFLALSAKYVKPGGTLLHRYDLGHALYPHSMKERFHVWLGNTVPSVLPERRFVRYVSVQEVQGIYETLGVTPTKVTYHQMPNLKRLEKGLRTVSDADEVIAGAFAWEMRNQTQFSALPLADRERLFPAVAVWGRVPSRP